MKRMTVLLALFAPLWANTIAAPSSTNSTSTNRVLMADIGLLPIIGAIWFFVALVFVLSLALVTVRKVGPAPGSIHAPGLPACGRGLLLPLALYSTVAHTAPPPNHSVSTNQALIIDMSSTAVTGGKATLSIGPLQRTAETYTGDYQMKVSPYFFKGEKGRLAIVVSGESLAKVTHGMAAEITGTATTSGKGGKTRRIDATVTPTDNNRGALTLWFISGDRKMVFKANYRFSEN